MRDRNFLYGLVEIYFDCEIKSRIVIEHYLHGKFPDFMKYKYPHMDMTDEEFKKWITAPPEEGKEKLHPGISRFANKEMKIRLKLFEDSKECSVVNDAVSALITIVEKKRVE
jgi:hypothetical protein